MAKAIAKPAISAEQKQKNKKQLRIQIKRHWMLYLFLLPCIVWLLVFCYAPMAGIVLAFKNYRFDLGIFGSEWAGLKHFRKFVTSPEFWMTIKNTLVITSLKLVVCFPAPIILALLLNEVKAERFKKTVQTLSYLPNFVSWVVVVQLMTTIFTPYGGIFNDIRQMMGKEAIFVMGEKNAFLPLVIFSDLWKNVGWGSIVYLAAITGVDQELYEAASIDGAGRWKCTLHITIPEISVTIGIMFIMAVGGMLNAGYDQILLLQQPANNQISQVLDTYAIDAMAPGYENYSDFSEWAFDDVKEKEYTERAFFADTEEEARQIILDYQEYLKTNNGGEMEKFLDYMTEQSKTRDDFAY